jgi:ssDNA-binding Zn-finger/Zn-ribbon topoisomerase 1
MPVSRAILEDLFETKLAEPPKPAAEDISLRDEKLGMGFPGERFDLVCPECGATMKLRNSKHGLFYGCEKYPACKASHGALNDGRPKGTPGNKETRKARIFAHRVFDRLWKTNTNGEKPRMSRSAAYAWMRKTMKLADDQAHIGTFTADQCQQLVGLVRAEFPGVRTVWDVLDADDDVFEENPRPKKKRRS